MIDIPATYESSRDRFRASLASFSDLGFAPVLTSIPLADDSDLTIDIIRTDATRDKQRLLILTTGLHGIEGYVGAGILKLFTEEYLPRFDPETTGVLLVHPINPYGMKHRMRVNKNNVDLNRNFNDNFENMKSINPHYESMDFLLNPARAMKSPLYEKSAFFFNTLQALPKGVSHIRETALMGQYRIKDGMYFGGFEMQEETQVMMKILASAPNDYAQIVFLDIHTGYGPRWQMTLLNPPSEKRTAAETASRFKVPSVAGVNPDEFYSINGDMVEYFCKMLMAKHPEKQVYAGAFEFGTYGDSLWQGIRSLRTTVLENTLRHFGGSEAARKWTLREYDELFLPSDPKWREKAAHDARQAFDGIFSTEGFFGI
jgi:hypothetical protein